MTDLSVAGDDTHNIHSLATGVAAGSPEEPEDDLPDRSREERTDIKPARRRASRCDRKMPELAKKSNRQTSKDTNTVRINSSSSPPRS
jgi:hypothetical protein